MILIADSGSTKTDWRILKENGEVAKAKTNGYNPYYLNTQDIKERLEEELLPQLQNISQVKEIFFYGAGASSEELCATVENAFVPLFPNAEVHIEHDLLGAARATAGRDAGIVGILGTGSNVCFYNGTDIPEHEPNLGFWLGDEGSGAHFGKQIVVDFLYKDMPADLRETFFAEYKVTKSEVLEHTYHKPMPSQYFARFAKFVHDNIKHPYCYKIVSSSFESYFDRYVLKIDNYSDYPIHFVGSIAYYYQAILKQVAQSRAIKLGKITNTPIEELVKFHREA